MLRKQGSLPHMLCVKKDNTCSLADGVLGSHCPLVRAGLASGRSNASQQASMPSVPAAPQPLPDRTDTPSVSQQPAQRMMDQSSDLHVTHGRAWKPPS